MTASISNYDDMIDSRDVIARIEELREELDPTQNDTSELSDLEALTDEAKGYAPDWDDSACLIRDSYFQDYAQQLAEDCCEMPDSSAWPARCIDWEQAARELQMDYTSVDYDGITYWIR